MVFSHTRRFWHVKVAETSQTTFCHDDQLQNNHCHCKFEVWQVSPNTESCELGEGFAFQVQVGNLDGISRFRS